MDNWVCNPYSWSYNYTKGVQRPFSINSLLEKAIILVMIHNQQFQDATLLMVFGPPGYCYTWRIIPFSKWLVTPIYKPFSPFGRGITLLRGLTNHGYYPLTNWDDPPSIWCRGPSWRPPIKALSSNLDAIARSSPPGWRETCLGQLFH